MSESYWDAVQDVEIVRVAEGETGLTKSRLTEDRLESIAEYWATPTELRKPEPQFAKTLGVSSASMRKWKDDPRMQKRVKDFIDRKVLYMMPDVISWCYEAGRPRQNKNGTVTPGDEKARRTLLEIGKLVKSGNAHVSQTMNVVQPTFMEAEDDESFMARLREAKRSGILDDRGGPGEQG